MSLDPEQVDLLTLSITRSLSRQSTRRLSNLTVSRDDLFEGPAIVAPPQHVNKPSDAHQTALDMELARRRLSEISELVSPTTAGVITPVEEEEEEGPKTTDRFAFAFDIDGVLIRGGQVIPEAIEAMKVLNGQNEYNVKV